MYKQEYLWFMNMAFIESVRRCFIELNRTEDSVSLDGNLIGLTAGSGCSSGSSGCWVTSHPGCPGTLPSWSECHRSSRWVTVVSVLTPGYALAFLCQEAEAEADVLLAVVLPPKKLRWGSTHSWSEKLIGEEEVKLRSAHYKLVIIIIY